MHPVAIDRNAVTVLHSNTMLDEIDDRVVFQLDLSRVLNVDSIALPVVEDRVLHQTSTSEGAFPLDSRLLSLLLGAFVDRDVIHVEAALSVPEGSSTDVQVVRDKDAATPDFTQDGANIIGTGPDFDVSL